MRQKGILFSVMVLLLLLALLSLHQTTRGTSYAVQDTESNINAYEKAADKYANIRHNSTVLSESSAEEQMNSRVLPFSYTIDSNRLGLALSLPTTTSVESYLEALNMFRVFSEDTNYNNEYDSLKVDINTLTPLSWGGSDTNVSLTVRPQCMKYSVLDDNSIALEFTCSNTDFRVVKRLDLNLMLDAGHDLNAVSCRFNGAANCPDNDYNSSNTLPYLSIQAIDANCLNCQLPQKRVRAHFNPIDENNFVQFKCVGASCTTTPIDMNFASKALVRHNGSIIRVSIAMDFNSGIDSFELNDTNIAVENNYFGVKVWK